MITELEYNTLKNILITEYPVFETYKFLCSKEWDGWKPGNLDDIYHSIGELFRSLEKDKHNNHLNLDGWCSSGGHNVGFFDNHLVISWARESISFKSWIPEEIRDKTKITISDVRKYSDICVEIDCIEFLRMYKIYKLWQKKAKVTHITPETTSLVQE